MGGPGRRGSYGVGIERRERILDAALARFVARGYSGTSLADIARDVGLTGPGLKHHFPSKDHLLLALAERRFDLGAARALERPDPGDGTATLRSMFEVAKLYASQPELMELFVLVSAQAADRSNAAHELFVARYTRVVDELTAAFEAEVAEGTLRADVDYRALAREAIAVGDGLQLQWVLSGGTLDVVGLTRAHLERLAPLILRSGAAVDLSVAPAPAVR